MSERETLTFVSLFAGIEGFGRGFENAGMKCICQVEINEQCRSVLAKHWPEVQRFRDVKNVTGKALLNLQDQQASGSVSSPSRREDGEALPMQGVLQREARPKKGLRQRHKTKMESSEPVRSEPKIVSGDSRIAGREVCNLPSNSNDAAGGSLPRNGGDSGDSVPCVQREAGSDRGQGIHQGSEGVFAPVDVICGGFPCQDLSVSGKRGGLQASRSGLFFEIVRIVKEMREATDGGSPTFLVLENVPGLLSSNGGRDFAVVLRELAQLGAVDIAWTILDAQYFGVAQRRRRVFVVADFRGSRAGEILSLENCLPWDSPPSRETGARVAGTISARTEGGGGLGTDFDCDGGVVHTLRAEAFDASEDGTGRGTPLIPIDMRQASRGGTMTNNRTDGGAPGTGIGEDGDPSHTVCNSHVPAVAYSIQERASSQKLSAGPQGSGFQKDVACTLEARHHVQSVGFAQNQREEIREMEVAGALAAEPGMKQQTYANTSMGVRRLMPIECERLQGFPDNWTALGHDGKAMSDSARYRMLGNAVCVNVAEWIGRRIVESTHKP